MKGMFITTETVDCGNHVRAWESVYGSAAHIIYDPNRINNDWKLLEKATEVKPDVIFYIGAQKGLGNPKHSTLRDIRAIAPFIHLCSDAVDRPWHHVLVGYSVGKCFDLQVSIDGAIGASVGFVTLTPVDPRPFARFNVKRDIRCGFSGTVRHCSKRSEIIRALNWFGGVVIRERDVSYEDHVHFMKRCQILVNTSISGSGNKNHIKGRVVEAGFAKCALLEDENSPIGDWFPSDCYISYKDPPHAAELIKELDNKTISRMALRLSEEVKSRYTPEIIYGGILERLSKSNDDTR